VGSETSGKGRICSAMSKSKTLNPKQLCAIKIGNLDKSIEDIKRLRIEGDKIENSETLPLDASFLTKITSHNQDLALVVVGIRGAKLRFNVL
jgi:hypothetical protein